MENKIEYSKPVPPFVRFCAANIPMVFDDSLSYYEALCALWKWLQSDVIDVINNNASVTDYYIEYDKETRQLFIELKNYVDNYFDNLDVQEEINNKLDAMVEDGTFEALLSAYIINGKGQVKYIFPNRTDYTSEYNLITAYDKNILIDCGRDEEYTNLTNTFTKYGIEHLDYMIISHFHEDHCENLISLYQDGYCDSDTILILPTFDTTVWAGNSAYAQYQALMTYITNNNISYINPTEGYTITIKPSFYIKIYNTDDTYYVDHSINSDYNNASLICLVQHFDKNILYTGDCYKHALNKIYNDGVLPYTLHLYKNGHHGIDNRDNSIKDFIRHFNILNAVLVLGMNDAVQSKVSSSGTACDLRTVTDNIFVSCYNEDNIEFSSYINAFNLDCGYKSGTDNLSYSELTVYVDSENATSEQNGTQSHPYANLCQALGSLQKNNGKNYTINVAAGTYELSGNQAVAKPTLYGCNNTIKIVGAGSSTILKYGFNIYNCKNIEISNLSIENEVTARTLVINNSNVSISNASIDGGGQYAVDCENNSILTIDGCSISNASYGLYEKNSNIIANNITFTGITSQCLYGDGGKFERTDNITVTDASVLHGRADANRLPLYEKGLLLFSGNQTFTDGNITLPARPARFRYLEINATLGTRVVQRVYKMSGSAQSLALDDLDIDNYEHDVFYYMTIGCADNYNLGLNASRKSDTNRTTGTITYTNDTNTFTITSVIAH
jgi:beta-lactamase superfamily II metal-dependent hydrolase